MFGDERVVEGIEVESGSDRLLAVDKRDGHCWGRRR